MERLELWLVRHGETVRTRDGKLAGWANTRLTDKGRQQAAALRPLVAGCTFAGVWCSDLARARATARLAWGEATPDRRLREIDFGDLEGDAWTDLEPRWREALDRFEGFAAPGGETCGALRHRVLDFVEELPPGRHLIFTHGGVVRALTREAGEDRFLPTGSLAVLDWPARRVLLLFVP